MSFKSLYTLFITNDYNKFNSIYNEKFNSESTIKFDIYINEYQSFFTYDKYIMSLVSKIRDIDERIKEIFSNLPEIAIDQYKRKSLIDEIEYTNSIEGVIFTRKDINDLINEIEKRFKIKNRFEGIVNKYLLLNSEKIEFNNPIDIRKLYNDMLYNEIKDEDEKNLPDGKIFRKEVVHVYKSSEKIIHNGIMPESKIIEYINKALNILNDKSIDILIRVSLFHYYFGYIHPFYDGNGRINRFISSYILSKHLNQIIGFRLSMTIKENLTQYLDAFAHTNDIRNRADVSTFVYEFLDIIYKSYQKTEIYALERSQALNKYELILDKIIPLFEFDKNKKDIIDLLYILIQCSVFSDFGLTKTNLCKILKKGNTKVTEFLGILKKNNLCVEMQSKKYHYYRANLLEIDKFEN